MADMSLAEMAYQYSSNPAPKLKPALNCLSCVTPICSVCNVCHTPGCIYREERVTEIIHAQKYRHLSARTQKARGFVNLAHKAQMKVPTPYYLILEEADIAPAVTEAVSRGMLTIFVRPCPMRARHGFEESRPVKFSHSVTNEEAIKQMVAEVHTIWVAANLADEEHTAELILLPYVQSKVNSILTPSRAAVGPNHDGATAGYESISIPLAGVPFQEMIGTNLGEQSGLGPDDDPYFEVVAAHLMEPMFTQLRAGVRLSSSTGNDYVPSPMRVKEVIDAAGDLLEWEAQVKTIQPGTVVVKLGGTLISHYGVHCLYNRVACFTTRRPAIGELLNPIGMAPNPDPQAVIDGLGFGALVELKLDDMGRYSEQAIPIKAALIAMMTTLHNSGVMSGDSGFWLGVSVSLMMRAGMAASHGEARHKLQDLQNMRSYVYRLAFKDFMGSRNTLGTAQWMFQNLSWSSSYGGKAWSNCTDSLIKMDDAVRQLLNEPTTANVATLVTALNVAVNQAHNGGWWLNKFIEQHWFDWASKQSLRSLAIGVHTMFYFSQLQSKYNAKELLLDWQTAPAISITPNGKLLIQVKAPKIDQTVFSDTVKSTKLKMSNKVVEHTLWEYKSLFPIALHKATDEHGKGVYCSKCGHYFDQLTSNILDDETPINCGEGDCNGWVGNYDSDTFLYYYYKDANSIVSDASEPDSDDDSDDSSDDEPEDNSWDETEEDEPEPKAEEPVIAPDDVIVPDNGFYTHAVDSIPSMKNLAKGIKGINMNGVPAVGEVMTAQVNFNQAVTGQLAPHVQYRTAGQSSGYYYSIDCGLQTMPLSTIVKIHKGQKNPLVSWSGSGVYNYWNLDVTIKGNETFLDQPELGLHFKLTLNPPTLILEAAVDEQKQVDEIKTEAETEAFNADDIPF